ncbi:hypothetical protein AWZ03_007538 [Drosophila navojoa]|uniref:Uncharacterized protein n=1 Tax=Drosophila navojoa TaxID=7232 RepID=A0A484BAX9_DRONA|nr:hypothetical protein AWZ03_007538 [Drosophila navojoa]
MLFLLLLTCLLTAEVEGRRAKQLKQRLVVLPPAQMLKEYSTETLNVSSVEQLEASIVSWTGERITQRKSSSTSRGGQGTRRRKTKSGLLIESNIGSGESDMAAASSEIRNGKKSKQRGRNGRLQRTDGKSNANGKLWQP